ncbi:MAG: quinoprotein relay system zinc metallohydrolase 2 [Pseudomonadota bacterium]
MFEAIIVACLVADPQVCRDQLVPGFEATDEASCNAAVEARQPEIEPTEGLSFKGDVTCRPLGPSLPMQEVTPGLFAHRGAIAEPDQENRGNVSNLGFIIGESSVAVIDTGSARWIGEALWRAIRQQTDLPVSHVILTHMHPDHVLGASAFLGTGTKVVGHDRLPRALLDRQANYIESFTRLIGEEAMVGTISPVIDMTIETEAVIDLGGRHLQLRAWPLAHTGSDLTVFDEESGTLFAGDLVFHLHTPALDGSLPGWRAALADLKALAPARIVPGHGGPVLDWPEGMGALNRYLSVLEADTRTAIDAGKRLGEAVGTIATQERHHWQLFDAYNPRNATVAFTELEWE